MSDKIDCAECGNELIIPEDSDGPVSVVLMKEQVMVVLPCFKCRWLNDIFYDFRESMCEQKMED
ncbi:hypothetical protein LCGC14_2111340 [marine sediment metagenome]|uniref:Uncharacterized protein n=1 Tax=marine sediment metagenome TaxID=412755 RepID=A0A0F9E728_9ZZZZ